MVLGGAWRFTFWLSCPVPGFFVLSLVPSILCKASLANISNAASTPIEVILWLTPKESEKREEKDKNLCHPWRRSPWRGHHKTRPILCLVRKRLLCSRSNRTWYRQSILLPLQARFSQPKKDGIVSCEMRANTIRTSGAHPAGTLLNEFWSVTSGSPMSNYYHYYFPTSPSSSQCARGKVP